MNQRIIRIATRQSPLALWQANHVRDQLLQQWPDTTIELLPMITSGDQFTKDKLLAVGGKGLFVKELEQALLDKRADIAVHSSKDMPAQQPEGLDISVFCKRDNPYDAFISKDFPNLDALPSKAVVGTASLRRQSQLLAYRPDLNIIPLRGNINTRLSKLEAGEFQAIILAASGLERMGFQQSITQLLSDDIMLPTCGQGALCIESRTDDQDMQQLIANLNDPITSLCVRAERRVNAQLGGNCHVPLAVFCTLTPDHQLWLRAKIATLDGSQCIEDSQIGALDQADLIADLCSQALFSKGAKALLDSIPL